MGITIFIVKLLFSQKPLESILDVSKKKILVIVPHPDDEILGLGGIILQMLRLGGKVHLVYLTDGESCGSWPDREEIKNRRTALSVEVCDRLGLLETDVSRLHLPDGSLTLIGQKGFTETAQRLTQIIEILQPDEVFATHTRDYMNHDHLACAQIAYEAIRQSVAKPQLWYYWVWAWYNLWPW